MLSCLLKQSNKHFENMDYNMIFETFKRLLKISKSLHKQDENACNYGLTNRQEKIVERLENEAEELAKKLNLHAYHQSDPRGASLYLVESLERADIEYTNGFCIY